MITCLITDRRRLAPDADEETVRRCLIRQVEYAVDAGLDVIQVRERDLDARPLAELVGEMVRVARGSRTRILVNERVDVALAAGAHGVHLRRDSVPVADVRRIAPPGFLVGRSVGSLEQAVSAGEADYLIAGTLWTSDSKPTDHQLLGIQGFSAIAAAVPRPVLAVGGVTLARAHEVARAGGGGIAAIGAFMSAETGRACRAMPMREIASRLRQSFDTLSSDS